jgi:phosphatidate cytidylyltransferase
VSLTRVASAVVLIAVAGGAVWMLPPWATLALALLMSALAGAELAGLGRRFGADLPGVVAATAAVVACGAVASMSGAFAGLPVDVLLPVLLVVMLAAASVVLARMPPGPPVAAAIAVPLLAALYVGAPLGTLAWTVAADGPAALTWLVAVIALSDTAQYYAGTLFGRRPLAPVVSPKKTVEGAIGGFIVGPAAGAALAGWALPGTPWFVAALVAFGLVVAGIVGDLFESLLKRSAGAKDSSALIPGHGGVLDRIDGYLFAGPIFFLYLRYLA